MSRLQVKQVGDIVVPVVEYAMSGIDYGYGIIKDVSETDDGIFYFEVVWPGADTTWWHEDELELISEDR